MSTPQTQKYEMWIAELERRQAELLANKPGYHRFFYAQLLLSNLAFFWKLGAGVACLFTAVLVWSFGMYTVRVRESDYRFHLKEARASLAKLKNLDTKSAS